MTGTVVVRIVYSASVDATPAVEDAPAVVLLQGARIEPARYDWLAVHLASRGYALVEPGDGEIPLDALRTLAEPGEALAHLVSPDGPAAVAGHALGGVVAARQWVGDPALSGLVLLASFAAGSDPVEDQVGRPVLMLTGTEDALATEDELVAGRDRFGGPVWLGLVVGMNHHSWVDDTSPGELARDAWSRGPAACACRCRSS